MYFEQFYLGCLAHASYMFGSEGKAAVVDPQRDVEIYLKAADQHGLEITHIFETHLHADFVSGHIELAERTGATIHIGAKAGATSLMLRSVMDHNCRLVRCALPHLKPRAIRLKAYVWCLLMKRSL